MCTFQEEGQTPLSPLKYDNDNTYNTSDILIKYSDFIDDILASDFSFMKILYKMTKFYGRNICIN